MDAALRGRAAAVQQQQMLQMQNQQYQQNHYPEKSTQHSGQSDSTHPYDHMSLESYDSRTSAGTGRSSQVDAYRRLGRRLSIRAHGDGPVKQPLVAKHIGVELSSSFTKFSEQVPVARSADASNDANDLTSNSSLADRTATKVAKTRYSDHGHHHRVEARKGNIVRKMTMDATVLFRQWETNAAASTTRRSKKRASPKTTRSGNHSKSDKMSHSTGNAALSPHRFALSQLALDGSHMASNHSQNPHDQLPDNLPGSAMHKAKAGLLSAVIENSSTTSSQNTTPTSRDERSRGSSKSRESTSRTGETKSTLSSLKTLAPGKCLTNPSEGVANSGRDNAEGNLIMHENDSISVSRKQIHVVTKEKMKGATRADFRVQKLLGQGTFAQVFQCLHIQTGTLVAVKVVKNKPAYTRQAAVEIDIFRALTKGGVEGTAPSSSQSQKVEQSPTGDDGTAASQNRHSTWDHMVDLVCYFMHQGHLCLVFEMLGSNLYEVLKKRQFRGLPLSVVRTLVKQALTGLKELAKKSIVHCDLKPENILLATDDDVDSVVSAGESRRLSGSLRSVSSFERKPRNRISGSLDKMKATTVEPPLTASSLSQVLEGNPGTAPFTIDANAITESPAHSLGTVGTNGHLSVDQKIKLIDFGSACFEGQTVHTYIQSRFYRSPEVLVGLPYDSAIDLWSLGCVAAELFLGLPILPGVHEHDQLGRICEMISGPSDWMLDQGSKASKYFVKYVPRDELPVPTPTPSPPGPMGNTAMSGKSSPRPLPQWRLRTHQEYVASLSTTEIRKKGGLAKLEKQPTNRYFKRKKLAEIISHKGLSGTAEDKGSLELFIHFLYGILDPDPWKRWTAVQAAQHPFLIGGPVEYKKDRHKVPVMKDENQANILCGIYWEAPWDPSICRRKLLNVQKLREKQQSVRRGRQTPARSPSAVSYESGADRMQESPRGSQPSPPSDMSRQHGVQQGLSAAMALHNQNTRLASSFSDQLHNSAAVLDGAGDTASVASSQMQYATGPMSYSGLSTGMPTGSYQDVDFVFAMNRPGVVPAGDSVASSFDFTAGTVNASQNHATVGSYGSSNINRVRVPERRASVGTSRSFGDHVNPSTNRSELRAALGAPPQVGSHHAMGSMGQVPASIEEQAPLSLSQQQFGSLPQQVQGSAMNDQMSYMSQASLNSMVSMDTTAPMTGSMPQQGSVGMMANDLQQQQQQIAFDSAQAYLQQQHVALQQQQLLLQQQQASLALQQQQLQAYGLSPQLLNAGMMPATATLNASLPGMQGMAQFPQGSPGYYYVAAADGAPMMVPMAGMQQPGMAYPAPPNQPYGGAPLATSLEQPYASPHNGPYSSSSGM